MSPTVTRLVFSDLDGSLLDHYSYSYEAAKPQIEALERAGIPLILVSSKTRAEILTLRTELANRHPFIVENGAAVFVPTDYFAEQPANTAERDGYWVREFAPPRSQWLAILADLRQEFLGCFDNFDNAGVAGIMSMTGLSEQQAVAANQREYSEPVRWLADPEQEAQFVLRLQAAGATAARGGRFISVSGLCDKGRALAWLRGHYPLAEGQMAIDDLAIGDSVNDAPMLEQAGTAVVVRSPVHDYPTLTRSQRVIYTDSCGPAGWDEGVSRWLQSNNNFT
ncbi:MAG: HAD-IIB family hydrolase [Halieaceae bacterium]